MNPMETPNPAGPILSARTLTPRPLWRDIPSASCLNNPYLVFFTSVLCLAGFRAAAADAFVPEPAGPSAAAADDPVPPPSTSAKLSSAELEKLVMPIALHPDPLIAVLLPASVYPLEIVQAARFVKDTNNVPKVDDQPWDDNVKAVAKFPELIAMMDADLPWTVRLGDAFLDQPKELMDTIQSLRGKAQKAGTLQSSPQQIVTVTNVVVLETNLTQIVSVTNTIVEVRPSNPEVVYVPSYPPTVYYPPPGYVYSPLAPLVSFGVGMAWGAVLANNCNWGHGNVDVDVNRNVNRNTSRNTNRNTDRSAQRSGSQKWQPDQSRRNSAGSSKAGQSRDARGWSGGSGQASQRSAGAGQAGSGNRQGAGPSASTQPSRGGGGGQSGGGRSQSATASPRSSGGSSAFSGGGSASSTRSASSRGASSRGGGGGGGRSGGGGRGGGGGGGRR